ncbi:MAG: 2-C-methyl-D-erythritol 4-phosphate cytidylyltransferase [Akkermansiaceae bacterium]|jgi:2-C-methyl-D-erythritol 4-phosphate cytidylyltransferase|nr:2-C-methyl-D-erythritol 4-phosphate cytidylyltransferase [Akkermansiaceae bacterium]
MSSPSSHPDCAAIIVAAGSSRRMGIDKLAWPLAGVPVLRRTLEAFLMAESIRSVVVVCPEERWKLLDGAAFNKPVLRADGGAERQDSVMNGLAALAGEVCFVAVHDGARPLVSPQDIDACVAAAVTHRAAALARRATETMKRSDADGFCTESVDRENLWCMETPQVFETALLREAYRNVIAGGLAVTDEVSAVQQTGVRVRFIGSLHPNLKITTPADLSLAEALIEQAS